MKQAIRYVAGIIVLAIWSIGFTAFAQTTANGPYYATPSWDQTLPSSTRFIVLSNFALQAVLDRETGLVWERTPSGNEGAKTYADAQVSCSKVTTGGRKGWRLPSFHELQSLQDPTVPTPGQALPAGHPFLAVAQDFYWTGTRVAGSPEMRSESCSTIIPDTTKFSYFQRANCAYSGVSAAAGRSLFTNECVPPFVPCTARTKEGPHSLF